MTRLFLIFFSFTLFLFAETIKFQEEKYIDAIDTTLYKKGSLEFGDNTIKLQYTNSDKLLIYFDDTLTLEDKTNGSKTDLSTNIILTTMFVLIDSVYHDKLTVLEEFFTMKKEDTLTALEPKVVLKNYIDRVEFLKQNGKLKFLTILMHNNDKTIIRQIDE